MNWTEEEYQDFLKRRTVRNNRKSANFTKRKASKYHARKVEKYDHVWDSCKELREYENLLLLKQAGEIKMIMLQPKFELLPSFQYQGKKQRAITYKADFLVTYRDGKKEVIEVKGYKTRDYMLRRKLFLYKYPDVLFREIT